ncbi:hypothetical protein DBR06_SOUSAS22510006, partial [Sousa chinensis]
QRGRVYIGLVLGCTEKFKTSQDQKGHIVRLHPYPVNFQFDKLKKNKGP